MDYAKIFGWVLLITGILVIGWTLMTSYGIFTGEVEVPEVFKTAEGGEVSQKEGIQAGLEEMMSQQLQGMLPIGSITTMLNLAAWSILAFILIFGGGQIAGLGIKLIKK